MKKLVRLFGAGWVVAAISLVGLLAVYELENELLSMPFVISIFLFSASLFFFLSRRIAFSVYGAWAVLGIIGSASFVKFKEHGFDLHAYDIIFNAADYSLYRFLVLNFSHVVVPVVLGLVVVVGGLVLIARAETPRNFPLKTRLSGALGLATLLPLTVPSAALGERHEYLVAGRHVSAFFVSLLDLPGTLFRHSDLKGRLQDGPEEAPFPITECTATSAKPDMIVILGETQAPPFLFRQAGVSRDFAGGFVSDDGIFRALGVETVGGGTWISTFSMLTGLSAADFGWQRPYVTSLMENQVAGAWPDHMADCGYATKAIIALPERFVNEGPFLRSIGFETVLDQDAIGAPEGARDAFFYDVARKVIAEHRQQDSLPLFLFVQTMFPHSPHHVRLAPETVVASEPLNEDPQIAEYFRRLAISRGDLAAFLEEVKSDPGSAGTVVLEFGDHQAAVTLPWVYEDEGTSALSNWGSLAYTTHYSVHSFMHQFQAPLPDVERLDIPFLAPTLLHAAGLPLSPMMEDSLRLRDICNGRMHLCGDRAEVDRHLRRRIASGLLFEKPHRPIASWELRTTTAFAN